MRYIIDASVALRWYLADEFHDNAEAILDRLISSPEQFAVPELFAFELLAVLLRVHPNPLRTYTSGVIPLLQSGLLRYPMTENIARRAHLLSHLGLTGYDAAYAALAEELEGLWLTFDRRAHDTLKSKQLSVNVNEDLPAEW